MLVLASTSPRRRELVASAGWSFEIMPADVDERPLPDEQSKNYVLRLAQEKAVVVSRRLDGEGVVIAADTAVVDQDEILGKPADAAEAESMLRRLRGRTHQVYTAVAVLNSAADRMRSDLCVTQVRMRAYSDEEMRAYIASGDPMDKAGAYAVQHTGFDPVEELKGCYANVVGLPMCLLARLLESFDIYPPDELPLGCQEHIGQACPAMVYKVLNGETFGEG